MLKHLSVIGGTAALLFVGMTSVQAQERSPGDTNVRALEAPADVRGKQIRAQSPDSAMTNGTTSPKAVGEQGAAPTGPAASSVGK
ncbi:hypothetical protein [Beijerinckia sp. L45]|uniref:hypothetical protein n=1 Tax=Beijerinckia sp. L45 TaxID=1641855 RepID=UPI00131DC22E|nr:hypothetical protein [Beijerinckia sp. L45]